MKVLVIGGGPAGMLAAISSAQKGNKVTILEKMNMLGKKLLITGKGRCNITSSIPIDEFIKNIPEKAKNLLFYDEVYFSDFCDGIFDEQQRLKKEHFINLYDLYIQIKDDDEMLSPFLTYIIKTLNDNCYELPF